MIGMLTRLTTQSRQWATVMLLASLLCLLLVTTSCGASSPRTVLVSKGELRTCAEAEQSLGLAPGALGEGCIVATESWYLRRLETEQALEAALLECK